MTPIFANSAWVRVRENLVLRGGSHKKIELQVRYGLVIHPSAGPVLIDTGYTHHSLQSPNRSLPLRLYSTVLKPELHQAAQPTAFLAAFGLAPEDVRFVVVSHFHADHISGLTLFPNARFIANDRAWSRLKKRSYIGNLQHGIFPELLPFDFEDRLLGLSALPRIDPFGVLPAGIDLFGDGSMIAIDLPGHADGQFGILFPNEKKPLLYGVDAQWLLRAAIEDRVPGFPARLIAENNAAAIASNTMICRFVQQGGELLLCHDPEPSAYDFKAGVKP